MNKIKYSISILTYKAVGMSIECVRAILNSSTPKEDYELILTANGNEEIAQFFELTKNNNPEANIRVVVNSTNLGFIDPNKTAFSMARGEFFVMLNDDTLPPDGFLEKLEKPFIEFGEKAAISGPEHNRSALRSDFTGFRSGDLFEYIEFSCAMLRKSIFDKIGLFSPYLSFAYGEDADTCLRARSLGYSLHLVKGLNVPHAGGATSRHVKNIKEYEQRNHNAMRKKWGHYIIVRKMGYPICIRRWAAHGDVLLVTAILEQLAKENPLSPIYIETAFPNLFKGNKHVAGAANSIRRTHDMRFINLDMAYENVQETHICKAYADACGITVPVFITSLSVSEEDEAWAKLNLSKFTNLPKIVAIHAGPTTWAGKNWPMERWNEVVKTLKEEGIGTVLVGHCPHPEIQADIDLGGKTTHGQLAAVIEMCGAFAGLDSFPIHVAQAVGVPVVGLFGVTLPAYILTDGSWSYPVIGNPSIPEVGIRHKTTGQVVIKSNGEAMNSISVESVLVNIRKMLGVDTSPILPNLL